MYESEHTQHRRDEMGNHSPTVTIRVPFTALGHVQRILAIETNTCLPFQGFLRLSSPLDDPHQPYSLPRREEAVRNDSFSMCSYKSQRFHSSWNPDTVCSGEHSTDTELRQSNSNGGLVPFHTDTCMSSGWITVSIRAFLMNRICDRFGCVSTKEDGWIG